MRNLTDQELRRIYQLRTEGKSTYKIARMMGTNQSAVANALPLLTEGPPDDPKQIQRPPAQYSNRQPFEYHLPVREKKPRL